MLMTDKLRAVGLNELLAGGVIQKSSLFEIDYIGLDMLYKSVWGVEVRGIEPLAARVLETDGHALHPHNPNTESRVLCLLHATRFSFQSYESDSKSTLVRLRRSCS
jgi:hypothetical protein